jgi:tetratricopeptide (TPR) repeat protein
MKKLLYITFLLIAFSPKTWAQADEEIDEKPSKENWKKREKFNDFFFDAMKEKAIGNYDKAIVNLEKCKLIDASDFTLNYEISLNYKYQKDYENAILFAEKAQEMAPDQKWIWYHLNTLYGLTRDYQKRAEVLKKLVDSMSNMRFLYASTLKNIRKYDEALAQITLVEKEQKLRPYQIGFALGVLDRIASDDRKEMWLKNHYKKYKNESFYPTQLLRFYKSKGKVAAATALEQELISKEIIKPKAPKIALTDVLPALKAKYEDQKDYKILKEILLLSADKKDWSNLVKYGQEGTEVFPSQPLVYLMYGLALNNTQSYKKAQQNLEMGLDFVLDNPKMEQNFFKQLRIAYKAQGNTKAVREIEKQLK